MTKRAISDVQSFLTFVETDGNRVYQIVNVELLLRRHPPEAVITFSPCVRIVVCAAAMRPVLARVDQVA